MIVAPTEASPSSFISPVSLLGACIWKLQLSLLPGDRHVVLLPGHWARLVL